MEQLTTPKNVIPQRNRHGADVEMKMYVTYGAAVAASMLYAAGRESFGIVVS